MQADAEYRMMPEDINQWYVRNNQGEMVPFSAFTSTRWDFGSPRLERYNGVPSLNVQGEAAPGLSTGDAMIRSEERRVGKECRYRWAAYHEEKKVVDRRMWRA